MKKIDKALLIFIIIQPFLDFYLLFSDKVTNMFKFSPSTIIRIIFVGMFFIYAMYKSRTDKKFWLIIGYFGLLIIYIFFHVINSLKFSSNTSGTLSFSYITEAFYYIRLLLPLMIIYIVYKFKIDELTFKKSIIIVSLIFSLEIIITNVFKISLTSYEGNNIIKGNIFDWFLNNDYTFEELASKGFFYMANQIGAVLIMLLPINIYYAARFKDKLAYFSSITLSISMIMLGTRVSTYGWILVAITILLCCIIIKIFFKNKIDFSFKIYALYLFTSGLLIILTFNSPLVLRKTFIDYEKLENSLEGRDKVMIEFNKLKTIEEQNEFILRHNHYFSIPDVYIQELYPFKKDPQLWTETIKLPYSKRGGNRNLEKLITKRIYNLNNNKFDKFVGMGYSRFRNAKIYIESDFIVHYYTIGIIGILLLFLPYIIIPIYAFIYMLKQNRIRLKFVILSMSILICLGTSYFSGHVLDEFTVTIILGYISGFLLLFIKHDREKYLTKGRKVEDG